MIFDKAIRNTMPKPTNLTEDGYMSLTDPADWTVSSMSTSGVSETGAMKLSAVNACVEVLTNSMSKLPIFVMNSVSKNHINHPVLHILAERPNEVMTPSVYKKLMERNRLLSGNAYAFIVRDPRNAMPKELIPLNPDYTTPWLDENGKLWYIFRNPKTGITSVLDNFDVIHYKAYSEDGIHGVSVLTRASEIVDTATAAQRYENRLYTQNARPTGILKVAAELSKEAKDKVREEWQSIYGGYENSFRIAVLDLGLDYQQISMSNKDTQFVESKSISIEDIARFFGVPLYKINAGKQSYSSNEQNAIEYVVNTLHPVVTQCEEEDTYKLLFDREIKKGLEIRRNMMAELRGDFSARGGWYKTMREIGAFSVDDVLSLEDMPKVPGGHTRNASLNYVPLELFEELSINRNKGGE